MLSVFTHFVLLAGGSLDFLPFGETLAAPLNWFSEQHVAVQGFLLIFSVLGFYLLLRIIAKIVEKIAGIFG